MVEESLQTIAETSKDDRANAVNKGVGTVRLWAGPRDLVPNGWLLCNGQELDLRRDKAKYLDLFLVIGTAFGKGSTPTSFLVPNLDRKVVVGTGDNEDYALGQEVGKDLLEFPLSIPLEVEQNFDAFTSNTENPNLTRHVKAPEVKATLKIDVRQSSVALNYLIKYR